METSTRSTRRIQPAKEPVGRVKQPEGLLIPPHRLIEQRQLAEASASLRIEPVLTASSTAERSRDSASAWRPVSRYTRPITL